jgi:hypothetical protein
MTWNLVGAYKGEMMSDSVFDPKKLPIEEQVMWEAANVHETVPSGWVKSLLRKVQEGRKKLGTKFEINDRVRVLSGTEKGRVGIVQSVGADSATVHFNAGGRFSLTFGADNLVLVLPLETTAWLRSVDYDVSIGGYVSCIPTVNAKFDLLASTESGSVGGELKLRLPKEKYGDYAGSIGNLFMLRLEEVPQSTPPMEPLPCPFCGVLPCKNGSGVGLLCEHCGARADSLEKWNRRVR